MAGLRRAAAAQVTTVQRADLGGEGGVGLDHVPQELAEFLDCLLARALLGDGKGFPNGVPRMTSTAPDGTLPPWWYLFRTAMAQNRRPRAAAAPE